DSSAAKLWRFDPETAQLEPKAWPATLEPTHDRIREATEALAKGRPAGTAASGPLPFSFFRPGRRGSADFLDDKDLALVSPIPDFEGATTARPGTTFPSFPLRLAGYTIVTLDATYIREQLFPALLRRHFGA